MSTTYPSLTVPAPARLAKFRKEALSPRWIHSMTWRDVRFTKLTSPTGWSSSTVAGNTSWYSHEAVGYFRSERDCEKIISSLRCGWYTDDIDNDTAIGIVASLSHGRFLAGYRWTANDERVYFPEVFDDEKDAARMADEHARCFAEPEREYQLRWREATDLQSEIEGEVAKLGELRADHSAHAVAGGDAHRQRAKALREKASDLCAEIRKLRERFECDYSDVEI